MKIYLRDPPRKQLIRNLRDKNVRLTTVFSVVGSFFGSMENIPFNKRSMRSFCASISMNHSQYDVRKIVDVFSELKTKDPNFRDSCLVVSEGCTPPKQEFPVNCNLALLSRSYHFNM
jgi:hypothetical protein